MLVLSSLSAYFSVSEVYANVSTKYPVEVKTTQDGNIDRMLFADHTSSVSGNWFNLSGGTLLELPNPVTVSYDGVSSKSYTANGITVDIIANFDNREITYPFSFHAVYYPGDTVTARFLSNADYLGEDVKLRLLSSSITGWDDALNDALDGNLSTAKNFVNQNIEWTNTQTIADNGDYVGFEYSWVQNTPGDYALVLYQEDNSDPNNYTMTVYGATPVEVLDYVLNVEVEYNEFIPAYTINASLVGATPGVDYSFGAALIHRSAYRLLANLTTDGTADNTILSVKTGLKPPVTLVSNSQVLGVGISDYLDFTTNRSLIIDTLDSLFNETEISYRYPEIVSKTWDTFNLVVDETYLTGEYILVVAAWQYGTNNRVVGISQDYVTYGIGGVSGEIITTNMPQAYANIINIEYNVTSDTQYIGAQITYTFYINDILVPESNYTSTVQLNATTQSITYAWDTLIDVPRAYKTGGAVNYTITIKDASDNLLTQIHGSGTMTAASKATVFVGRLNPLAATWSVSTPAEKGVLFTTYLNPLAALWSEL